MSTLPDQIKIEFLRTHGIIGLRNPERLTPQDILVSVTLDLDLRAICQSDNVADGVNYSDVSRRISAHVSTAERHTIETLATDIAGICLSYERVTQVRVRVSKPAADRNAQAVAVDFARTRADLLSPAIIALGSNDSPERKLPEAAKRLSSLGQFVRASAVYETQSVGAAAQHPYLNAAIRLDTVVPAAEIRRQLKRSNRNSVAPMTPNPPAKSRSTWTSASLASRSSAPLMSPSPTPT